MPLTKEGRQKRELFAAEYARTDNLLRAYRVAGYKSKSGNDLAERKNASAIRNIPEVAERIAQIKKKLEGEYKDRQKTEYTRIYDRRSSIAYTDISAFLDTGKEGFPLKHPGDVPDEAWAAVREINVTEKTTTEGDKITVTKTTKLVLHDPNAHLSALEEKHAIMPDNEQAPTKVEVINSNPVVQTALEARKSFVIEQMAKVMESIQARREAAALPPKQEQS